MKKTAFFTVFYPTELSYHREFMASLEDQSNHDFDLFIINDGVLNLNQLVAENYSYSCEILTFKGDMFQIREQGIKYLIESGYENIIFGDSDDYFSKNRVEVSLALLDKYSLVINDVSLVTSDSKKLKENYFGERLSNNFLFQKNYLDEKNIIGFSNSAIKSVLLKDISFECASLALDWFIFVQAMEKLNATAIFTKDCQTYYRQHNNNTASIDIFTEEKFIKGLDVKYHHYKSLKEINKNCDSFYRQAEELWLLCKDEQFRHKYFNEINEINITNPFWWERIKLR